MKMDNAYESVISRIFKDERNHLDLYFNSKVGPNDFTLKKYVAKVTNKFNGKAIEFDFSCEIEDDNELDMIVDGFFIHYYPSIL